MGEVEVSVLNLQRLVSEAEIREMRRLRKKGLSIPEIARIISRSPTTVKHYLKSNERMGRSHKSREAEKADMQDMHIPRGKR